MHHIFWHYQLCKADPLFLVGAARQSKLTDFLGIVTLSSHWRELGLLLTPASLTPEVLPNLQLFLVYDWL